MIWMFIRSLFIKPNIRRNVLTQNASVSGIDMLLYIRNAIQALFISGSSGMFTLTFDGQITGSIAYDASMSTIKTALEALSNIASGDIEVVGTVTGTVYVGFKATYAGLDVPLMTAANVSGDVVVTTDKIRNDIQKIEVSGATGTDTYKLTYRGQITSVIEKQATPASIESKLETLSTIDDVSVEGIANTEYILDFFGSLTSNMDIPELVVSDETGGLIVTITSPMPDTNLLGGQRSTVLSRTIDKADATNKDSLNWEESVPIIRHWSISCPGFVVADETDVALEALKEAFVNGLDLIVLIKMPSGNQYEGIGHLDSYDKEGPFDGIFTASLEVSGNGVLTKRT